MLGFLTTEIAIVMHKAFKNEEQLTLTLNKYCSHNTVLCNEIIKLPKFSRFPGYQSANVLYGIVFFIVLCSKLPKFPRFPCGHHNIIL